MRLLDPRPAALLTLLFGAAVPAGFSIAQPGDLETRVAYQRAIEDVYAQHRLSPENNDSPRSGASLSEPALRAKVEDALLKSRALEQIWGRPITGAQLQAELERMARNSKQPQRLAELWDALGNDPRVIAEMLARPLLADRLVREWYAHDERFHGELEASARQALASNPTLDGLRSLGGPYQELEWIERSETTQDAHPPHALLLAPQDWETQLARLARALALEPSELQAGVIGALREDSGRFYVLAILERGDDRLRIATVEWRKRSFDSWWQETREGIPLALSAPSHAYRLPELGGAECVDDTWRPTLAVPDPRYQHTAVWTGSELIVWGGMSSVGNFPPEGGRYDPATDTWASMSQVGAPGRRAEHTAVWTGTKMIVWGGVGEDPGNTGGRYDPATDSWLPTSTVGAPTSRSSHVAVWTGGEMIIWGGGGGLNSGGRYNPVTDSWRRTSLLNAPDGRNLASVVWTGTEMIVWGGFRDPFTLDTGGRYNPATNTWQPTSQVNVPSFRHFHTAVWTGEEMIVWGGVGETFGLSTGARYDPDTDTWRATRTSGAPPPRWLHEAQWTGTHMVIWGGTVLLADHPITGGRYDPVSDTWAPTSTLNVPEGREDAASVWTGAELIVWGGLGDDWFVNNGGRYDPTTNSWLPTQTYNVPTARGLHTAAWTGAEMMIYGGDPLDQPGGLYDPATDSWRMASEQNAPRAIQNMTSVWTGNEVIVWGGFPETDEGGRYDPATNTWQPTSLVNTPGPRYAHTAVWTGSEMIIWGGWPVVNTGARYDPSTDTWTPTSTVRAPRARTDHAGVWTGSEMIVWSGYPETAVGRTGGRYDPATDTWRRTNVDGAPARRSDASGVWTGTEAIFWGGGSFQDFVSYNTGGRYDPASDSWRFTTTVNAPSARVAPAVWTGDEMIIWGGVLTDSTGGRYNPLSDTWRDTSLIEAPPGRWNTTLVWTGSEAIVWGGIINTATGGLYCARLEGNQRPVARPDSYSTEIGIPVVVGAPGVLANDSDGNGDPLSAVLTSDASNGELTLSLDGSFSYEPDPGFAGTDGFVYRASDGQAASNPGSVTIDIACTLGCVRSTDIVIDLLFNSTRGRVMVRDETNAPVHGALVRATWTLPNGNTMDQQATSNNGLAVLNLADTSVGTFTLTITNIEKNGLTFDPVNSVLVHRVSR